jgi:3-dehydroquinate dehydratase
VVSFQTNSEAEMCERIHQAYKNMDGVLINAGAWTHYSYGIRDALRSPRPGRGLHMSASTREEFRHRSVFVEIVRGRSRASASTTISSLCGRPCRRRTKRRRDRGAAGR